MRSRMVFGLVSGLVLLGLAACGLQTGPAGQLSIASRYNPANGEVNTSGGGH